MTDRWERTAAAPTGAAAEHLADTTIDDLFRTGEGDRTPDEKLRQAYFWLANSAVVSPYHDVEFSHLGPTTFEFGDAGARLNLPTATSYASGVLLPLLTFAVGGRCLLVGGPGRGKTTIATVLAVMAGSAPDDVRRDVQQGHPQLGVADLVGLPLPRDIVEAEALADIRVAWRAWLTRPVKIIDEVNRIPTKTQSAMLTMVEGGYVESHDQVRRTTPETGGESWFFTANDDSGGGTFPIVQALRDRFDVTVSAAGFNARFLDELIARVERRERPEDHVPTALVFTAAERDEIAAAVRAIPVPGAVVRELGFFHSHFEYALHGGRLFEHRSKDAAATAGADVGEIIDLDSGADLLADLGTETVAAPSPRALQSVIRYAKAMAYFRGVRAVTVDDVRAVLPFALRNKLRPHALHPRFDGPGGAELVADPDAWIHDLWDRSHTVFVQLVRDNDPVGAVLADLREGLDGVSRADAAARLARIEALLGQIAGIGKLLGWQYADVLTLKHAHQRYTNYLAWVDAR